MKNRSKQNKSKQLSNLNKIQESPSETESDLTSSDGQEINKAAILLKNKQKEQEGKKKSSLLVRVVSSVFLISFMCLCYAGGHMYYSLFLLYAGFKCYFELINIKRDETKDAKNRFVTILEWYCPLSFCYYLLPKTFIRRVLMDNDNMVDFKQATPQLYAILFIHHGLICAFLLLAGLVLFTLSLEKGQYRYQFKRLGWQILCTLLPISGSLFFGYYVYKGFFWLVLTNGSVMINDIMAFVFGKLFGRTKLIQLSPNKTVEGFIGGGISTIFFAIWISDWISQFKQITCPQNEITFIPFQQLKCDRPEMYDKRYYDLPFQLYSPWKQVHLAPAQIHAAVIALFAAVIAPFGGFFASGLKRGLKIKDFSDSIPGHGGFADRFDCHIIIAFFVYVYLTQVVYKNTHGIERIFDYIQKLEEADKYKIYLKMHEVYKNATNPT